jgi:predicted GIY-YIG superfamily endonuclease
VHAQRTGLHGLYPRQRIKKYPRAWKINLILEQNPDWRDLADGLNG